MVVGNALLAIATPRLRDFPPPRHKIRPLLGLDPRISSHTPGSRPEIRGPNPGSGPMAWAAADGELALAPRRFTDCSSFPVAMRPEQTLSHRGFAWTHSRFRNAS